MCDFVKSREKEISYVLEKEAERKDVFGVRGGIVKERCMEIYNKKRIRDDGCIYQSKKDEGR